MKNTTVQMDWDKWIETFKPEMENDAIKQYWNEPILAEMQKMNRVWTALDSDGIISIGEGRHFVNRMYYIITEKPYDPDNFYYIQDQDDVDARDFSDKVNDLMKSMFGIDHEEEIYFDQIEGSRYDGIKPLDFALQLGEKDDLVRIDIDFLGNPIK